MKYFWILTFPRYFWQVNLTVLLLFEILRWGYPHGREHGGREDSYEKQFEFSSCVWRQYQLKYQLYKKQVGTHLLQNSIDGSLWFLLFYIDNLISYHYYIKRIDMELSDFSVTFKSAPNIALVKYWGKYNQNEIIPINDSLGLTLSVDDITTTTTCTFSSNITQDQFILNHKPSIIKSRLVTVLEKVRQKARKIERFSQLTQQEWNRYHFKIESTNNFPSASGMASSASGYSCLAAALNSLFGGIFSPEQLSRLTRRGSGSAIRALFGGLVLWKGVETKHLLNGDPITQKQLLEISEKSISYSVVSQKELNFIKIIALITQNKQKEVPSTVGMKISVQTSEFIKYRNEIANSRIEKIVSLLRQIIKFRITNDKEREYEIYNKFAELVIKDSNSFHAVCLDSYPPISYMNQFSKQIVHIVHNIFNSQSKKTKVAYTFDAGPHAFLFVHQDMLDSVVNFLYNHFGSNQETLNAKAKGIIERGQKLNLQVFSIQSKGQIPPKGIWVIDIGNGPEKVMI